MLFGKKKKKNKEEKSAMCLQEADEAKTESSASIGGSQSHPATKASRWYLSLFILFSSYPALFEKDWVCQVGN